MPESILVKFCKKCLCETERHPDGRCKPCKRAYLYEWRRLNPDKFRAIQKKWDDKNKDHLKAAASFLYLENRDSKILYAKEYYEVNKDKLAPKRKAWQRANLEACRISDHKRRAAKVDAGGTLSKGLAKKLFSLQKGKCPCCGLPLGENFHMDHIVPLARGGSNTDDNIQLLRQRCTTRKHAKDPIDFMQSRGFLL